MKRIIKARYLKWIVALVYFMNIVFAAGVLYVFYHRGSEPKELIRFWGVFNTAEILIAYGIKIKDKEGDNKCKETSGLDSKAESFY